jgi:hypothetical protein
MKERPILFSAPMVRAILAGQKTQTRRVVKGMALEWLQPEGFTPDFTASPENGLCPYGQPGDRLWVRETWSTHACFDHLPPNECPKSVHYWADGKVQTGKGRPSIHMPRAMSRITLEITSIRVERLTDISTEDCIAEGIDRSPSMAFPGLHVWCDYRVPHDPAEWFSAPVCSFKSLWESINGPKSWGANPWVWVVEFRRVQSPA